MPPAKSVENTVVAPAVDHSASDSTIEPRKTGSFMPAYLLAWDGGQQHDARRPTVRDSANPGWSLGPAHGLVTARAEEHTSERQSLTRISYAVFCLEKKTDRNLEQPLGVPRRLQSDHQ